MTSKCCYTAPTVQHTESRPLTNPSWCRPVSTRTFFRLRLSADRDASSQTLEKTDEEDDVDRLTRGRPCARGRASGVGPGRHHSLDRETERAGRLCGPRI